MSTTTPTKPKLRPKRRRRKRADAPRCTQCGDQLAIRWRRRWWCVGCDAGQLFNVTGPANRCNRPATAEHESTYNNPAAPCARKCPENAP